MPLSARWEDLLASAGLGRRVAALLDVEQAMAEVTTGAVRRELRLLGRVERLPGLMPGELDLKITTGWRHAGQGGVCMPGQRKLVRRDYDSDELAALDEGARSLALPIEQLLSLLGESTLDVYLNDQTYWKNVPGRVWSYTLGGYQVIKEVAQLPGALPPVPPPQAGGGTPRHHHGPSDRRPPPPGAPAGYELSAGQGESLPVAGPGTRRLKLRATATRSAFADWPKPAERAKDTYGTVRTRDHD